MEHLTDTVISFFISMVPVFELRGGILFAAARGVPFLTAFFVCLVGNILPVPFILLFLRKVFSFLERFKYTKRIVLALERRARSKKASIEKYQMLGLFILVAIPLPGTGAWTGSLVAVVLDMRLKRSFPVIALGVLGAGIIMSVVSFLLPGLFFPEIPYSGQGGGSDGSARICCLLSRHHHRRCPRGHEADHTCPAKEIWQG
jgi:uncharacterized membrane protein